MTNRKNLQAKLVLLIGAGGYVLIAGFLAVLLLVMSTIERVPHGERLNPTLIGLTLRGVLLAGVITLVGTIQPSPIALGMAAFTGGASAAAIAGQAVFWSRMMPDGVLFVVGSFGAAALFLGLLAVSGAQLLANTSRRRSPGPHYPFPNA